MRGVHSSIAREISTAAARSRRAPGPFFPEVFTPQSLFANGEEGAIYDPADEHSLFSDYAGTTNLITDAGGVIANIHDLSGHGYHGTKLVTGSRPVLTLVTANGSYRRGVDYTGGKSLSFPLPNMGTNCTVGRARPGIGAAIATGQTISGALNDNTNFTALVAIDRALTATETANLTLWLQQRAGTTDQLSQVYGPDSSNEICDVFHSSGHPDRPIIVMVHGGGWRNGSKASPPVTKNKLQHWLPLGYTFVSMNYKLDVGTDPIDQAHSVARCVAWVKDQAKGWGCDPRKVVLMGHSAGGHLVALVSANSKIRGAEGMGSWLGTVCIDAAAYDVPAIMTREGHLTLYDEPWGTDEVADYDRWVEGSPTYALDSAPPPMLCITSTDSNPGEADLNVGPFVDAVNALGGTASILHTELDHGSTNNDMGLMTDYTTSVDDFLATLGL